MAPSLLTLKRQLRGSRVLLVFAGAAGALALQLIARVLWLGGGAAPQRAPTLMLRNVRYRTSAGNTSCVIVGCHSPRTAAAHFWKHYSGLGYVATLASFDAVVRRGARASPKWCRVPAVLHALRRFPRARVVYADLDTLIDVPRWCGMRGLGANAPIVMNSLLRTNRWVGPGFSVHGTMVQTNAFVVAPGNIGRAAMRRWERSYYNGPLRDQGAIHRHEGDVCGVPGWIACFRNPEQQECHCTGGMTHAQKTECIRDLFGGRKPRCVFRRPFK